MSAEKNREPSKLGGFILTWLRQRGWNATDLADKANVPAQSLSHVISGYSRKPELETLNALAEAMDEPLTKLLEVMGFKLQPMAPDKHSAKSRRSAALARADDSNHVDGRSDAP